MANYIVQKESLESVADSIRAKAGISEKLEFPLGWKAAVESIRTGSGSGGGDGSPRVVEIVVNIGAAVSVTAEDIAQPEPEVPEVPEVPENYTHCLYNGVRLPKIPEDVLAQYPYAWIRNDVDNGKYELMFSEYSWYYDGTYMSKANSYPRPTYAINFNSVDNATGWGSSTEKSAQVFGLSATRTVLWSNHDIPNGSATATDIYFAGSDPVPTV